MRGSMHVRKEGMETGDGDIRNKGRAVKGRKEEE